MMDPSEKDAFEIWWEWATKDPKTDLRTIPAEIHDAVMTLTPEERKDRAIVNETVRTGKPHYDRPAARIITASLKQQNRPHNSFVPSCALSTR
jgi:hypothetical protein